MRIRGYEKVTLATGHKERGIAFSDPSTWEAHGGRIGVTKPTLRSRREKRRAANKRKRRR